MMSKTQKIGNIHHSRRVQFIAPKLSSYFRVFEFFDATAASTNLIWQVAIDHCEALTLGGHNDWRLPNIRELKSITDRSKTGPAIKSAFLHTVSGGYWSSTTHAGATNDARLIYFEYGYNYKGTKGYNRNVRCVR